MEYSTTAVVVWSEQPRFLQLEHRSTPAAVPDRRILSPELLPISLPRPPCADDQMMITTHVHSHVILTPFTALSTKESDGPQGRGRSSVGDQGGARGWTTSRSARHKQVYGAGRSAANTHFQSPSNSQDSVYRAVVGERNSRVACAATSAIHNLTMWWCGPSLVRCVTSQ